MTLRAPVPICDIDDSSKLRERLAFYKAFPATLHADIARKKALAEGRRLAREDRLRASWIYGEEQPDV